MMGMSFGLQRSCWIAGTLLIMVCSDAGLAQAYKNYTVGDSLGWYDDLIHPGVDYQKWADSNSFSLGNFLIFNTDNNHSVVQTNNVSSYKSCDYTGEDSTEWSMSNPSSTAVYPITVAVPLLKEGVTYFFSGDYDGWQCQHGLQFEIKVSHGQGLPPSLNSSMAPSPSEADSGDDDSVPDTVISGNFNHPKNDGGGGGTGDGDGGDGEEANVKAASGSDSVLVGRLVLLCLVLFMV